VQTACLKAPLAKENIMSEKIKRREDINTREGLRNYWDVKFADPVNNKYPINTPKHIRAAWSYIHHKDNAAKYDEDEVEKIKGRIRRAAKIYGIQLSAN
jgi:hypothetical protein